MQARKTPKPQIVNPTSFTSIQLGALQYRDLGVVLKVIVEKWEYISLNGDPNQTGNLHYGHVGDRYFEQLPFVYAH